MRTRLLVVMSCLAVLPLTAAPKSYPPKTEPEAKAEVIVGCKETKLYHKANCKWVKQIEKAGTRVDFKSVAEAKKAGMKPCGDCKPGE